MTSTTPKTLTSYYTVAEEIANAITHGIGVALSIAGLVIMIVLAASVSAISVVSVSIFGATLILLYLASTLYHAITHPRLKYVLNIVDHCAIYLLIAGTYTPIALIWMRGAWGWAIFGTIWGLALVGIIFKMFFIGRFELVSTLMYVAMGWLCVIAWRHMTLTMPAGSMGLLIAGGITYTIGVPFYLLDRLPFNHAIWHGFVLGGSICHFLTVALYL